MARAVGPLTANVLAADGVQHQSLPTAKDKMTAPPRKPVSPSQITRRSTANPVKPLTVFFLRHGEAGQRSAWAGASERPLPDDGREQVRRVARALARLGLAPELVLSSPCSRH